MWSHSLCHQVLREGPGFSGQDKSRISSGGQFRAFLAVMHFRAENCINSELWRVYSVLDVWFSELWNSTSKCLTLIRNGSIQIWSPLFFAAIMVERQHGEIIRAALQESKTVDVQLVKGRLTIFPAGVALQCGTFEVTCYDSGMDPRKCRMWSSSHVSQVFGICENGSPLYISLDWCLVFVQSWFLDLRPDSMSSIIQLMSVLISDICSWY